MLIIIKDLSRFPPVRRDMIMRPTSATMKYSGGPNRSAAIASVGAMKLSARMLIEPATKEPTAETASAAPARPRLAIL